MLEFTKLNAQRKRLGFIRRGDVILYDDKLFIYDRIPQGGKSIYTIGVEDMKSYKLVVENGNDTYFDVVGHKEGRLYDVKVDTLELKEGDLFLVDHNIKGSYIYRFERYTTSAIIATNPMNNKEIRISKSFNCTKIENIPF